MSVQLQELIDRIKQEGVQEAERQAAQMRQEAQHEAERIVSEAKERARVIVEEAAAESARFEAAGREALNQAGRDVVLNVKKSLIVLFQTVLKEEIGGSLDAGVLKTVLVAFLEGWAGNAAAEILLPEKQRDDVVAYVMGKVAGKLKGGVEIKPSPRIEAGFKISEKNSFYDFTDRGITEFLMEYLNPRVAACLEGKEV